MKFLIFILIIFLSHLSDAQNSTSSALGAKTSPTLPPFSDPFWPYPLGACLTCNYPLFATFINGELPNGEYQPGYPYEYRKPCECPRGIPKVEIDHACFPNHVLYPYYESCHHKAYCCEFGSCNCTNCPPNKHVVLYNPPNFECQCNNYMLKCANLTEYNKETCVCECPRDAYLKCPANQYFDRKTCSCLCRDPCDVCSEPQVWNPKICNCECPYKSRCGTKFWNEGTCQCECNQKERTCCNNRNRIWSSDACNCVCIQIYDCRRGYVWNDYTCRCERIQRVDDEIDIMKNDTQKLRAGIDFHLPIA